MLLRNFRMDAFFVAASAALALGGMLIARNGDASGWWILLAFSCSALLVAVRPYLPALERESDGESIDVTPWGVRRYDDQGLHEAVSWPDLTEVAVVTSRSTADGEDVHLLLRGQHENGVVIPHTLAVEAGLLTALEHRLRDFDNEALVNALMSPDDGAYVLWRAPMSAARVDTPVHVPAFKLRAAS